MTPESEEKESNNDKKNQQEPPKLDKVMQELPEKIHQYVKKTVTEAQKGVGKAIEGLSEAIPKAVASIRQKTSEVATIVAKNLDQFWSQVRSGRQINFRVEKKFLRKHAYYRCDICHQEHGPAKIKKATLSHIEEAGKRYLTPCSRCGRWTDSDCWNQDRGLCRICVKEEPPLKETITETVVHAQCPQCNAPLNKQEAVWTSPTQYQCPFCNHGMIAQLQKRVLEAPIDSASTGPS